MQSLCTLLLIRSARLSTKKREHNGASRWSGGGVVGEEKDSKSEVEGRKEDQGMKREGKEERIKEGLKFLTLGKKKKKKSLNI